jgi:hypothetical protein
MCMISLEVAQVSDTKILVGLSKDKKRQITIYSNKVDTPVSNNAMIIPVHHPESVQFINLSNYKNIFDDCESCFFNESMPQGARGSLSYSNSSDSFDKKKLEVYDIGSYKVSLAMNLDDLKHVDTSVFELSKGCNELLEKTYKEKYWGFIICKLAKGKEEYHPFAYSNNMLDKQVFIPTKHFHMEHKQNNKHYTALNINDSPMFSGLNRSYDIMREDIIADDWSHDIYLYNISNARYNLDGVKSVNNKKWDGKNPLQLDKINFDLDHLKVFDKLKIIGRHPNIDLVIAV